ncbi:MAG: chemotaxis protein CheX [Anaerolineae bacterium]
MNVQFLNPFIEAAYVVLESEVGVKVNRGPLRLDRSAATATDVTVLISMVGQVNGVVMYGLSEETGIKIVSKILGQPFEEFDSLAQSGIGELGNVITGQAGNRMAEAGFEAKISPPTMVLGKGTLISTLDFERLHVPLQTEIGTIEIHLALREMSKKEPVKA